jgi:hypothetical protein
LPPHIFPKLITSEKSKYVERRGKHHSIKMEKNKIQNKQSSVTSTKCACCGNDYEELYVPVPDDVLEEASAARYQMLPKKSKLRYQQELEKITSE